MAGPFFGGAFFGGGFFGALSTTTTAEPTGAGRGKARGKQTRYRIRLDDKDYEFSTLQGALDFVKRAKRLIPDVAPEKAAEIVAKGIRIGEAKRENKTVTVLAAPSSTRQIVEDRIAEMERYYWSLVQRRLDEIEADDEEVWQLM